MQKNARSARTALGTLLDDPLTRAVMRSDNVSCQEVLALMDRVRKSRRRLGLTADRDGLCAVSRLCDGILPLAGAVFAFSSLVLLMVI